MKIAYLAQLITIGYFAAQAVSDVAIALKFLPVFGFLFLVFFLAMTTIRRAIR